MRKMRTARALRNYALLACLAAAAIVASARPGLSQYSDDWRQQIPGFGAFGRDTPPSVEEQRTRREQVRGELSKQMEAEFHSEFPLASQATIDGLQRAVTHHQAIVEAGGWPRIPEGTLRRGDSGQAVTLLRRRLALTGDLRMQGRAPWQFDQNLEEAVARFQSRHGLRVTGLVDRRTLHALNVSAHERLRLLQLNLIRLSELEETTRAGRHVIVNSPDYRLEALQNGMLALRSRVVVGRPDRETPDVSTRIIELNFYPHWHVPESIAARDLIPTVRKDPDYFYREHFSAMKAWGTPPIDSSLIDWSSPEVFDLRFRQDPGPFNALGVVRINMPNKHTVYLHDTPLKQLFGQGARAFSSGCVRVERVLELSAWLAQDLPDWDLRRVEATVDLGETVDVKLPKPVPVHFVYVTAWASPDGTAQFRPDIYRRDDMAEMVAEADDEAPLAQAIAP